MDKTLAEIAKLVGGNLIGDGTCRITGVSGIEHAKEGDISFLANSKYVKHLTSTQASAMIVGRDVSEASCHLIQCDNPSLAFSLLIESEKNNTRAGQGEKHPTAVISDTARLGEGVTLHPYCVIDDGAVIGDNSEVYPFAYLGRDVKIGNECVIHANVSIREGTVLGNRVIIQNGSVVGSDGFGYVEIDGKHRKIPQTGIVEIEDDVEIGACVTIDRARFDVTKISKGTKIDNLVQIAHNVELGENCIVVSQVGIAGSTKIGKHVIFAAQSGATGHITVGDNTIIGARGGLTKSLDANMFVSGLPAQPHELQMREEAARRRLPKMVQQLRDIEKRIKHLEEKTTHNSEKD